MRICEDAVACCGASRSDSSAPTTSTPSSVAAIASRRRSRRRAQRAEVFAYVAGRWKFALAGSLASLGSYGIALWAMTRAPVAVVAALREVSVVFAAILGTVFLNERFGWRRLAGAAGVAAGVAALRL